MRTHDHAHPSLPLGDRPVIAPQHHTCRKAVAADKRRLGQAKEGLLTLLVEIIHCQYFSNWLTRYFQSNGTSCK